MHFITIQYLDAQIIFERNITTYFLFTVKRPVDHNKTELSACHFPLARSIRNKIC